MRYFLHFLNFLKRWRQARLEAEIERHQQGLLQAQWHDSLAERTQEADLASGYNQSHFNTMQ